MTRGAAAPGRGEPSSSAAETNYQRVTRRADGTIQVQQPRIHMSAGEAVTHAAWLVMIASLELDDADGKFARTLRAIRGQ